jgi:hypothetical protein
MLIKKVFFLLILFLFPIKVFTENQIIIEAEEFEKKENIEMRNFGGVKGILFKQKGGFIETNFQLEKPVKANIYIRVYFPWLGNDTLIVEIDDNKYIATAKQDNSGRWNIGNFQIWHWFDIGEVSLDKGTHKIIIKSESPSIRIDKIALYYGKNILEGEWFIGPSSYMISKNPQYILGKQKSTIIEIENFEKVDGIIEKEGKNLVVKLSKENDKVAGLIFNEDDRNFHIWVKIYFDGKNMFEGYTMEEMANQLYFSIDGVLEKTVFCENGKIWFWAYLGEYKFTKGKHLLTFEKVGIPVKLDKIVFCEDERILPSELFDKEEIYELPFDIPNDISFSESKRVSDYRVFGNLCNEAKINWLGREKDIFYFPIEVQFPQKSGWLVFEKIKSIKSSEGRSERNKDSQISMFISGITPDIKVGIIYFDNNGEAFFSWLSNKSKTEGKYELFSHNIPLSISEKKPLFFDKTGEKPEEFLSPVFSEIEDSDDEVCFSEGGNNDGIPDYPLEIKYIIFKKESEKSSTKVIWGEPFFEQPFEIKAKILKVDNISEEEKLVSVEIMVKNKTKYEKFGEIYYTWKPYPYEFIDKRSFLRTLECKKILIPPEKVISYTYKKILKGKGTYKFFYTVGQSEMKFLFFSIGVEAKENLLSLEKKFKCFYIEPIKKQDGNLVKRKEVSSLYGKEFIITCNNLDITSQEYAEINNLSSPLIPIGFDLSDENGWPEIEVPPGIVAIDPILGRIKFHSGSETKLKILSKLYTGFGVPGSGRIRMKDNFIFIPPGEGEYTIIDVSDKENPKLVSFIPSWYFCHDILFYKNYAYFESSRRGLKLVDDISNPWKPGYIRSVNFDRSKYGWMKEIYEDKDIGISESKEGLFIHSLKNVLNPKNIEKIEKAENFFTSPDKKYAFTYINEKITLLDMKNPEKPIIVNSFLDKEWKIICVSNEFLALRKGDEIHIYRYGSKKDIEKVGSLKIPSGCGFIVATFNKNFFYLIDGKGGPGQYSIGNNSPKSRWLVYEIKENSEPIYIYEDKYPSAYSSIIVKDDYGYIADYNYGLWIFDLKDPKNPQKISGIPTAGEADAIWVGDKYGYMWQTFGGTIFIIDITNPEDPKMMGNYWDGCWINYDNWFRGNYTIVGKDNFFFVSKLNKGISIVDVSNPAKPKEIGILLDEKGNKVEGHGACLFVRKDRLYVIDKSKKLICYDISCCENPKLLSYLEMPEKINTLFVKNKNVFLASNKTLYLITFTDSKMEIVSKLNLENSISKEEIIGGIAIYDNYIYLTIIGGSCPSRNLAIIDISEIKNPKLVKIFTPLFDLMESPCSSSWADFYQDLVISGNFLFIGNYGQIECYDISDPENPKFYDRKHIGYQWSVGMVRNGKLYVPTLKGLFILSIPTSAEYKNGEIELKYKR